jgi:hypothetical protein
MEVSQFARAREYATAAWAGYVQKVAGQAQRHRCSRLDDCVACLNHIHVEDGFARDLLEG